MESFPITSDSYSPDYFPLPQQLAGIEFDSLSSSSSGCSGYNSPVSCCTQPPCFLQRSASSFNNLNCHFTSSYSEFMDSNASNVGRVFSTGDMEQGMRMAYQRRRSASPLSDESSAAIIESMSKACRYSPEEKKERIERYRSKRSLRNFNKKIKYVCRKTLADNRPRIRGRFVRNDEIEKTGDDQQSQWSQFMEEEGEEGDDNWVNLLNSFPTNFIPEG